MNRRVLVTRPEPAAAATARRLAGLGVEPVLLPLTQTRALPIALADTPKNAAALAITSANAVRHAPKELVTALARLPCHAVGERTAHAAREAGFMSVAEGPGDAEGLAATLAAQFAGQAILYLCGKVRFAGFERELASAGVSVFPVETYDTITIGYDDDAVATRLGTRPVDAVLLYSAKAAEAMLFLAGRPELAHLFKDATFLCLSDRVAAALAPVDGERIRVSPQPNEQALLGHLPA
jgi:uroporphyrinogen-III synthase